jgi:molybdate transport system substrate-binding protein
VIPYAKGLLALWVRKDTGADPASQGMKALLNPAVKQVSIANPKRAPYGSAAETVLRKAGLHETILPKVVFAENINQVAQYLYTHAAEAGFIALSLMDNPTLKETGWIWPVSRDHYAPVVQGAFVLKRSAVQADAQRFLDYLVGPEGFTFLQRYGFEKPR